MKNKFGFYILTFVVFVDVLNCVVNGLGCYKENKRWRYFRRNPGDFDPNSITPNICAAKCGSFKFQYAAIAEGRFCFCGDELPDSSLIDNTKCTDKCSGNSAIDCGSKDYVSVFTAAPPILGLTVTSSAGSSVVVLHNGVTFTPSLTSGGAQLAFKLDYDDGAGKTDQNATNMWQRTYNIPGHYRVSLFGNDQMESLMEKEATTTVMVDAPVKPIKLVCPQFTATHEKDYCTASVLEGSNLFLEFYENSVLKTAFSIADPPIYITGPAIPNKGGSSLLAGEAATIVVMPASEFTHKSVIIGFELYAEVAGAIDILILSPACGTPAYCFDTNSCMSGCSGIHERSCTSNEFCPSAMSCWTSGSGTCDSTPTRYDGTQRTNLAVVRTITHTIASVGYEYISIDTDTDYIEVSNGYVLGYKPTAGKLNAISTTSSESDVQTTDVTNKATATAFGTHKRHLLRAISSGGSKAHVPVMFTTAGVKDISVTISNKRITGTETNSTQINVMEGVNKAIPNLPQYIQKGQTTTFQLQPHTGTNVTYTWDFGDGSASLNTTDPTYDYTYSSVGEYTVSVTAFNPMSSKSNTTVVQVEELITGLSLANDVVVVGEVTSIPTGMSAGSNYTCTWKKDGVLIATTDDVTSPVGGFFDYTFPDQGSYVVSATCANHLGQSTSSATIETEYKITNLQLVKTGALKNVPYSINWTWTDGTNPNFILTYDSVERTFTKDTYFNLAYSEWFPSENTVVQFPVNLTAYNRVSNEQIVTTFGIEEEITNPTITCSVTIDTVKGYGFIANGDSVTFTATATGGTTVTVEWNYDDGSTLETVSLPTWSGPQIKSHTFNTLGFFDVEVKIYNSYNSKSEIFRLLAIAQVQNINMVTSPTQALFLPPATVAISFTKAPADDDPNEATMAINYGDSVTETVAFDVNTVYYHEYRECAGANTYSLSANISNPISSLIVTGSVQIIEKIEGIEILPDPPNAPKGDPVNINVRVQRAGTGADVSIEWNYGDGSAVANAQRTGTSPNGIDTQVHTYNAVGSYTITVKVTSAMETVTQTKTIVCQDKVTRDLTLTTNHPQDFTGSGGAIVFNFLYAGSPVPTSPSVLVNYGDGSVDETKPATWLTSPSQQTWTHTYSADGDYVTTVTLSNLVSSEVFQISSGVYKNFVGLSVTPKYKPFIPINGPDVDGFGPNKDIFPLDTPVKFHMARTDGTFVYYDVMASNGGDVIVCNKTTEAVFELWLNQTGTYSIQITAKNPMYSQTVSTSVIMMKKVIGAKLQNDGAPTTVGQTKTFTTTFEDEGSSTCVAVEYGDGAIDLYGDSATCSGSSYAVQGSYVGVLSGTTLTSSHTYNTMNTYAVQVHAFNAYSSSESSISHVVSSLDCSQPHIDIKDKTVEFWQPTKIEKSKRVRVIGVTSINCGQIIENIKEWKIESVDANLGTELSSIDISAQDSRFKAELDLPPLYLAVGLYKVTYTMEMKATEFTNNESFSSAVSTYISIVPSKLVVRIFSGGMAKIQRGWDEIITIDPLSNSYDPDLPAGSMQSFSSFTWLCREVGEAWPVTDSPSSPYSSADLDAGVVDNGGCFKQGPGRININSGSLTFDTRNMNINKTYEFKVTASKTGHDPGETSAFLEIVDGSPPHLEIRCVNEKLCQPLLTGVMISPSASLGLLGACSSGCDGSTKYRWKFYSKDHQYTWKELKKLTDHSDGVKSKSISIHETAFQLFPTINDYQVTVTATSASGQATAYFNLAINRPPSGGACSITPNVGIVWQTQFSIVCSGWADDDGIAEYQMYCKFGNGDDILKQIYFGTESRYDGFLPLGPDYNDYKMSCDVRVKDSTGSFSVAPLGDVQVNPVPVENATQLFSDMETNFADSFDKVAAEGDINAISSLALTYSTLLSMATANDYIEYDGLDIAGRLTSTGMGPDYTNRTSAFTTTEMDPEVEKQMKQEYEEKRNTRSELTNQIMSALENCTISTTSAIAITGSAMAELTQFSENCARPCQERAANLAKSMTNKLEELSETSSKEDIVEAAKGVLAALGNVEEAGITHKSNPTIGDKESVEPFAQYDVDLESPEKAMPNDITDFTAGGDILLVYTNENFQEKTTANTESSKGRVLDILRNVLDKALVPGEKPVVINTPKMTIQFEKQEADQIVNKTLEIGNGKVDLPSWCDLQPVGSCNPSETVMLQSTFSTYPPYQDAGSASQNSPRAGSISLDLYDSSGNPITIKNTAQPIVLYVPLDKLTEMPVAEEVTPFIPDRENEFFQYHNTEINYDRGSLHVIFDIDDPTVQFLVLIRRGAFPNITSGEFDFTCLVGPSAGQHSVADGSLTNVCYVSSDDIDGYKGKVYIAVRQIQPYEHERYRTNSLVPTSFSKVNEGFTTNYTVTTLSASCNYYHPPTRSWKSDGCNVGPETGTGFIQCICNHATTFSGGWVVVPNTIDWNFVFSNADFLQNPTLYATMITIGVVYLITVVWARRQDKRDVERLGLAPLADNDKKDKYFYEIVVVTGMRRKAGTDSKVQFILSGEDDETDVRTLSDSKRKILRRGGVDGFLMATPRPLGNLNYLHIWHDNSGKGTLASWYMRSVVIRDVQTDQKFIFIGNKWFAVEEDDGQIDRVIPVAGREQMTEFSHLFTEKTTKSLSDGHLWFSVVARPPQSRFTRVQRVSCCLCLLCLTMLTNAMFYEKDEGNKTFTFGPFALSPEQIYIGVISNIIVFPVTFLIITLFRKSRPKNKRPSRVQSALSVTTQRTTSMTDVNPTLGNSREGTLTPSLLLEQKNRPDTSMSRGYTSLSVGDLANQSESGKKKKKKKWDLPWFFVIISWILLWLATFTATAFVIFYGIQFQDMKCKKWITSMLVSFIASVFITQPIKVFLTAIVLSLIVKNPGTDDDDDEEDEEKPKLSSDEQFLHDDTLYSSTKPRRAAYNPPDPTLMEKARQVRLKEIKMWSVVRELVFYTFFLWILMVISYRNRSQLMYTYKNSMEQVFIVTNDTNHWFMKAKNMDDFWSWAKSGMGNGLRALNYYNDEQPLFLRGYINDKQSRIMGYATMRQLRVRPDTCMVPKEVKGIIHECNDEYSIMEQQEDSYDVGWKPLPFNATPKEEYKFTTAEELEGYPYWGEAGMYSGGGYVVRLRGNVSALRWKMTQLQDEGWIDRYTRAVFVEFTVYNPGVNLFAISTMLAEFRPSQGIIPSYRFEPVMLFPYMNSAMLFVLACEITYMLFAAYFIFAEARNIYKEKLSYFKQFWNLVELGICAMSVTAVVIYFYRMFETNKLTDRFKVSHGNEYMKFQYVGYWSEIFTYIIGWLVFFATLKFLKLLRFNKKICMLASTMKASCWDLLHFSVIFNIVFIAFIQLFYMIYVPYIKSFKNFVTSCESGIVMMMGKFDIYAMKAAQPILTQIFLFLYVVMITFIVVNMFLSILNETFTAVRVDNNKQNNDYEIVQFMIGRLKMWTGLGTPDKNVLKPNSVQAPDKRGPTELFPDQIDRLLHSISHIYMEKERLDQLFDRNAYGRGRGADMPMYDPPSVRSIKYEKMTMFQK